MTIFSASFQHISFEMLQTKKQFKSQKVSCDQPSVQNLLKTQDRIDYQRFILRTIQTSISQAKITSSYMDGIIEQLQASLDYVEDENEKFTKCIEQNQIQFQKWAEEGHAEQDLIRELQPQMQRLEKNRTSIILSQKELLKINSQFNALQLEFSREEGYLNNAQQILKQKQAKLTLLRKNLQNQDKQKNRLFKLLNQTEIQEEEMFSLKKRLNNDLQEVKGNIRVYCRVRPLKKEKSIISVTSDNTLKAIYDRQKNRNQIERHEQGYVFQQIFGEKDSQHNIFTEMSQLVQNAIDGKNVCIFAYGQTGSGKTYTLLGPDEEEHKTNEDLYNERGLAPRSFQQIFKSIETSKKFKWVFKAYLSIQEIYLENIIDLISKAGTVKDKCIEVEVNEVEQVLAFLKEASFNRKKAATNMNERSSRSHLIITLRLEGFREKSEDKRQGSLVFVDLAGSERLKQTKVEGDLLKETQFINKSLSTLGAVINEMRKGVDHVSFRNSKLTHVLQRYLQGESKTLMFVNVSPDYEDMNQTKISLGFAENVRDCKLKK